MSGFRSRASVAEVFARIDARVHALEAEAVPLFEAASRVLAEPVRATAPVPPFERSAMDGYAVRSEDVGEAPLRVVGRSRPGSGFAGTLGAGEAVEIATGAPMPEGADAVARVEATRRLGDRVEIREPVPPGRHVGAIGEDVAVGEDLLTEGRMLRPQDLGLLSAQGRSAVAVVRRPRVAILITGEEILPAGTPAQGYRIPDMNAPMLSALVARDGGVPSVVGPIADDREAIRAVLADFAASADLVLVSGGSSTGPEDHAPALLSEMGEVVVHGVMLRPASPVGLGWLGRVPVVLLPGNPVSCLCGYDFFAGRAVRRLGGRAPGWPYRRVPGRMLRALAPVAGRVDYARVRLVGDRVEPIASGGASILSSATRSDGFVVVEADAPGLAEGELVTVWLYDK
jgi:molybdopterin molybdotransferase